MAKINIMLYFLITLMMIIPLISSEPTYLSNFCSNTTMFATNSQYQTNLNTVFRYLSANATNNPYHAAQAGNGNKDFVYGHFLCRGDQTPSSCQECVSTATNTDLPKTYCPNRKDAIIWYDQCLVRYSNKSFFGVLDQSIVLRLMNTQNVTGNVSQFIDKMDNMMNDLVIRAASGGPNIKYATNYIPYPNLVGIYGLEQCTPDLSTSDCGQCLVNAIGSLPISKGGQTILPSCFARFEISPFFNGASNLTLSPPPPSLPPSSPTSRNNSTRTSSSNGKSKTSGKLIAIIVAAVVILFLALLAIIFYFVIAKSKKNDVPVNDNAGEDFTTIDSLQYDLATLKSSTNNFGNENKLGEGGFGIVYKGVLPNGGVIAVKRLSISSGQGVTEFKNELLLLAKLQHRNLARLLGFCLSGEEKLLVYEFAPNKSLDNILFDPITQEHINWGVRYNIIQGIARGMLYLHQDSRLRIIHRDLKASNILLDANMNPKISDFGMARIFGGDQTQSKTNRVVGTFGYMSPEYVMHGRFSMKSDVYSFGVLILEIISGKRNTSFYESGYAEDLISYAWKLWKEGQPMTLVDAAIRESCSSQEVMRCIHLGLLCVQESVEARPSTETVVLSLDSFTVTLPIPGQPAFFSKTRGESDIGKKMISLPESNSIPASINDVSPADFVNVKNHRTCIAYYSDS